MLASPEGDPLVGGFLRLKPAPKAPRRPPLGEAIAPEPPELPSGLGMFAPGILKPPIKRFMGADVW